MRVTRAIDARIKRQLLYSEFPGVFFVSSLLLEFIRPTRFGGVVTKYACLLSL